MSDAHEELVRRYYERQGYFVRTNVPYQTGGDRGQWADLDLCILHPQRDDAAVVEVKGWNDRAVTLATINDWDAFKFVKNDAARATARSVLARDNIKQILVLPRVMERDLEAVAGLAREHTVVIESWQTVLQALFDDIQRHINPPPTSESENVIRALLLHGEGQIFGQPLGVRSRGLRGDR